MKEFYTKETPETLREIRAALLAGETIEVHNLYETVYGTGFDGWLRNGIEDINTEITTSGRQWEYGYPFHYTIKPIL